MALYLGNQRVKLYLGDTAHRLHVLTKRSIIDKIGLFSSDGLILRDKNGLYLVPGTKTSPSALLSLDNYILTDKNSIKLLAKEK